MTELGTRLKEARLSKGYSLDDLQDITKIQKRYLVGIEEGNYAIMPGTFYIRAFIKQYAEAVGLSSEELLEQYKNEIPNTKVADTTKSVSYSPTRKSMNTRSSNRMMETMPKVIVALFIIVIIAVIWFLYLTKVQNTPEAVEDDPSQFEYDQKPTPTDNGENEGEAPAEGTEDPAEDVVEEPVEEEEPEPTQTISEGAVQADGQTTIYQLSGSETMNLRIEVSGNTWVGIRDSNGAEQIEDRVYAAGEVVEFDATANAYARIRLGAAAFAKVFINDQELTYTLNPSEPGNGTQNIIIQLAEGE